MAAADTTERLARLEAKVESVEATTKEGFGAVAAQMDKIYDRIDKVGNKFDLSINGSGSTPGIVVRVDRLEQSGERFRWIIRAVLGALVTLMVGAAWAVIKAG